MKKTILRRFFSDSSVLSSCKISGFIFDPFMVKMQSEKCFCYFFQVTNEIKAKINELESESKIFA